MNNNLKYVLTGLGVVLVGVVVYMAAGNKIWNEEMQLTEYELIDRGNYGLYGQNVDSEDESFGEFQGFVIDNQADWKRFWEQYIREANTGGFDKEPTVNFDEKIVIVMLQGIKNSGGYYLNTVGVEEGNNTLQINVALFVPGKEDANTQVVSSPYEVIKIGKSNIIENNKYVKFADVNDNDKILTEGNITKFKFGE